MVLFTLPFNSGSFVEVCSMERDTRIGRLLALFLVVQCVSVSASPVPVADRELAPDSRDVTGSSAGTSQLGAVDHNAGERIVGANEVPAVWDGAVATYNIIATPRALHDPSVFVADVVPSKVVPAVAPAIAESVRAAALPAPMAWWLLMAGLVGVVGVARRRNVVPPSRHSRNPSSGGTRDPVSALL